MSKNLKSAAASKPAEQPNNRCSPKCRCVDCQCGDACKCGQ